MKQEDIIRIAREAGFYYTDRLRDFAILVAAAEREACAELKNSLHPMNFGGKQTYTAQELLDHMRQGILDYSDAIRARGQA